MKTKLLLVSLLAAAGAFGVIKFVGMPKMRYTVHVIGEDGEAIQAATATTGFNPDAFGFGKTIAVNVITDENGNFTAEGYSETGMPGFLKSIGKDGYYDGGFTHPPFALSQDGSRWLPWDQAYTAVLRKIGNPIPMYARNIGTDIPAIAAPCGFDLEQADWVAPYGKGIVPDFFVTLTNRTYNGFMDFDVQATISFPNPGDGIQEAQLPKEFANSQFKWPREAPETGYQPKFDAEYLLQNVQAGHSQIINTAKAAQGYFFRVRTVEDAKGNIISALYGKIIGGIELEPRGAKICDFTFIYCLNPTSLDRNMEYDFKKDLFKNLPNGERPHAP